MTIIVNDNSRIKNLLTTIQLIFIPEHLIKHKQFDTRLMARQCLLVISGQEQIHYLKKIKFIQ